MYNIIAAKHLIHTFFFSYRAVDRISDVVLLVNGEVDTLGTTKAYVDAIDRPNMKNKRDKEYMVSMSNGFKSKSWKKLQKVGLTRRYFSQIG